MKLNLLPYREKIELQQEKILRVILLNGAALLLVLLFFIFVMISIRALVDAKLESVNKIIAVDKGSAVASAIKKLETDVIAANLSAQKVDAAINGSVSYYKIIMALAEAKTANIIFDEININANKKEGSVVGRAKTRDDLLSMKSNLEKSSLLANIVSPLSNLVKPNDVNFKFEFNIK